MVFKDKYTTESIKSSIATNPTSTPEIIAKENAKVVVTNDAYALSEQIERLIIAIGRVRL